MTTHPLGRLGVGKNHGVRTTEFPLLSPSEDVIHLFADAQLTVNPHTAAGREAVVGGLRIYAINGFGTLPPDPATPAWLFDAFPTHSHDCVITNRDGLRVLNTADAVEISVTELQGRLRRVVWSLENVYTLVLTYHTKWPTDGSLVPRDYRSLLVPANAILCDTVVTFAPLTRLLVDIPDVDNPQNVQTAVIQQINDGYNTTLRLTSPDRFASYETDYSAVWSVEPGSGLGRVSDCDPPLQTINGVAPGVTGEFTIGADPCMVVHNDLMQLFFHNDCRDCCGCDDYAQAGVALDAADLRYRQLAIVVEDFRETLVPVIERWNAAVTCANSKVLSLQFSARLCPTLLVAIGYCNITDTCASEVVFALNMSGGMPTVIDAKRKIRPEKGVSAEVSGSGIVVRISDVPAKAKETVHLTLKFPGLEFASQPPVLGILQAAVDGQPLMMDGRVVQANAEAVLRCPAGDDDFVNL